jgi:hypothetical protein
MDFMGLFGGGASGTSPLAPALEKIVWNAAERGPLLVVLLPEVDKGAINEKSKAYNVTEIGTAYKRTLARIGTLNALILKERTSVGGMDFLAMGSGFMPGRELLLMAELDDAQLKALGSNTGLSYSQLTSAKQREMFMSLAPTQLRRGTDTQKLSQSQRQGMRLRLTRSVRVQARMQPNTGQMPGAAAGQIPSEVSVPIDMAERIRDPQTTTIDSLPDLEGMMKPKTQPNVLKQSHLDYAAPALNPAILLKDAQTVGDLVKRVAAATKMEIYADPRPAKRKVFVRATARSGARAGDVLKAIAWSLNGTFRRLEDPKTKKSVYVLTESLVPDVGGGMLSTGALRGIFGSLSQTELARMKLQARNAGQYIRNPATLNDPFMSDKVLVDKLLAKKKEKRPVEQPIKPQDDPTGLAGIGIAGKSDLTPITELNPAQQAYVRTALQSMRVAMPRATGRTNNANTPAEQTGPTYRDDVVQLDLTIEPQWILPDGSTPKSTLGGMMGFPDIDGEEKPDTEPLPYTLPTEIAQMPGLALKVQFAEEAKQAVTLAGTRGWREVWLSGTPEAIREAVREGQRRGVLVRAIYRLLRSDVEGTGGNHDLTAKGERGKATDRQWDFVPALLMQNQPGGDWLQPDHPATVAKITADLKALTAISGLAGIVLTDMGTVGYINAPEMDAISGMGMGMDMGYSIERRLALIRKTGCDPIDLGGAMNFMAFLPGGGSLTLSGSATEAQELWNKTRKDALLALHKNIFAQLKSDAPTLPVFVQSLSGAPRWYGVWQKPEVLPTGISNPFGMTATADRKNFAQAALSMIYAPGMLAEGSLLSTRTFGGGMTVMGGNQPEIESVPPTPDGPLALARTVRALATMSSKQTWNGFVLDLRQVPFDQVESLLAGVAVK